LVWSGGSYYLLDQGGFFLGREEEGRRKESAEVMFIKDFVVSCNVFFRPRSMRGDVDVVAPRLRMQDYVGRVIYRESNTAVAVSRNSPGD
jgi:hypothetical protein